MNLDLLKNKIQSDLNKATEEFMQRPDISSTFGMPQIAYVNVDDVRFDMLFIRGLNDHPKKIYRPGKCIITYCIPFGEEIAKANEEHELVAPQWSRAYTESIWLAMILNRIITKDLDMVGRLHSLLNTMLEWDMNTFRGEWNHKLVATMGGLGSIGVNGAFYPKNPGEGFASYGGRCGGVITDGLYGAETEAMTDEELKKVFHRLMDAWEIDSSSPERIKLCPCGAISERGIDRSACQEFCLRLNKKTPEPDTCGKCYKAINGTVLSAIE